MARAKLPAYSDPTPEDMDFHERLDKANSKTLELIEEAKRALASTPADHLPKELTEAEKAEQDAAAKWMEGYKLADKWTDTVLERSERLFQEVIGMMDEVDLTDVEYPPDVPEPTIDQVDMPPEVRAWVERSKQPWREPSEGRAYAKWDDAMTLTSKKLESITVDLARERRNLLPCLPELGDVSGSKEKQTKAQGMLERTLPVRFLVSRFEALTSHREQDELADFDSQE